MKSPLDQPYRSYSEPDTAAFLVDVAPEVVRELIRARRISTERIKGKDFVCMEEIRARLMEDGK